MEKEGQTWTGRVGAEFGHGCDALAGRAARHAPARPPPTAQVEAARVRARRPARPTAPRTARLTHLQQTVRHAHHLTQHPCHLWANSGELNEGASAETPKRGPYRRGRRCRRSPGTFGGQSRDRRTPGPRSAAWGRRSGASGSGGRGRRAPSSPTSESSSTSPRPPTALQLPAHPRSLGTR